jgi:hypothetical protein
MTTAQATELGKNLVRITQDSKSDMSYYKNKIACGFLGWEWAGINGSPSGCRPNHAVSLTPVGLINGVASLSVAVFFGIS